jgi:hypothetical protein
MGVHVSLGLLAGGCMVVIYTLGSMVIPKETRATSFSCKCGTAGCGHRACRRGCSHASEHPRDLLLQWRRLLPAAALCLEIDRRGDPGRGNVDLGT